MSDPISNDYGSVKALTEDEQRRALLTLACLNGRARKPKRGDASFADVIDMLGLTETAWEVVGRPKPSRQVSPIPRDAYGRARADHAPVRATPEAKVCRTSGHDLSEGSPNVYIDPTTGKAKCKACRQERERDRRARAKQNRLAESPVDPDLCRCAGEKHQLVTSPNGRKHCPVSTLARQRINRAKAKDARTASAA